MKVDFELATLTVDASSAADAASRRLDVAGTPGDRFFVGGSPGSRTVLTLDSNGQASVSLDTGAVSVETGWEQDKTFGPSNVIDSDNSTPPNDSPPLVIPQFTAVDTVGPNTPAGALSFAGQEETIDL